MRYRTLLIVVALSTVACGDSAASDPERFCAIDGEMNELGDPFELPPDEARRAVREGERLIEEGVDVAPDELKAEVRTWYEAFGSIVEVLEAADFDASRIDEAAVDAAFEEAFSGEAGEAFETVEAWMLANC